MTRCTVDSNLWGIVVEGRGSASVKSCEVRKSTLDGILVQDGGTALLEDNTIHHNTVHGIFIGYDVRRQVTVRNNSLHHNAKEGIVNGVPKVKKVIIEGNKEWDNMRMLVDPAVARVTKRTMDRLGRGELQVRKGEAETKEQKERKAVTAAVEARRWNENARKTGGAEELRKAVEYVSTLNDAGILDEFNARRPLLEESVCLECGTPTPDGKKPFVCGRCKVAVYCSAACQKAHWKKEDDGHKGECKKFVEYCPSPSQFGLPCVNLTSSDTMLPAPYNLWPFIDRW
ncbi:hypothetical protein T484DRAFT_2298631 [Baffinella frigidus]|nr:hypothetical protein T484DRAFT_2298631 [Cryptophyta sp. CCMP2293]